jgi:hypothetical protein
MNLEKITPENSLFDGWLWWESIAQSDGYTHPMRFNWDNALIDHGGADNPYAPNNSEYLHLPRWDGDSVHRITPRDDHVGVLKVNGVWFWAKMGRVE